MKWSELCRENVTGRRTTGLPRILAHSLSDSPLDSSFSFANLGAILRRFFSVTEKFWHFAEQSPLPSCSSSYDSIATVGEIRVYRRADFQSGSRVLKKVF